MSMFCRTPPACSCSDACSYLFGSSNASEEEINALFQDAWRVKHKWPKFLLLPESIPTLRSFAAVAMQNLIPVEVVPESALAIYIIDVQSSFREHFGGEATGAA